MLVLKLSGKQTIYFRSRKRNSTLEYGKRVSQLAKISTLFPNWSRS